MIPTPFFLEKDLRPFLLLWSTQALSSLGSSMTNFALVLWAYQQNGSALETALLAVCSYAPYVLLSIFAGALSDRWNKKRTMLISDSLAALCTLGVFTLLTLGRLDIWHLYLLNTLNGLMNTVQQPAADVAVSLLAPPRAYQQVGGLLAFSNTLVTILNPVIATALFGFCGLRGVILVDLSTFALAFCTLLWGVAIPEPPQGERESASLLASAKSGLLYLRQNRGVLDLILFLALINFTASAYNAALPPMLLSRPGGGEPVLAMVNAAAGLAALVGSMPASLLPQPKSRVRVILNCLLFSMSTESFLLAFGRGAPLWCLGGVLGWLLIPVMNANLDALLRTHIPLEIQGRVYAARNTLQFFTIPLGYLAGGFLIDRVLEPFMAGQGSDSLWVLLLGSGKGSGAALLFLFLGLLGFVSCLPFRRDRRLWDLER